MTTIYFNPNNVDLIYAIVAIMDHYSEESDNVLLASETVNCFEKHPPEADSNVFIFNIGPRNEQEVTIVDNFLNNYGHQLELWINKDKFDSVNWIDGGGETIQTYSEASCLLDLMESGYNTNESWTKMANDLASGNYEESRQLVRLYRAWWATRILWNNGDSTRFSIFLQAVHAEIISDIRNSEISRLNEVYTRIRNNTTQAHRKIICQAPFRGIVKREIGYADLGEISIEIDIDQVIRTGKIRFPWLSIVQYVYQGQQYTAVFSDQLKPMKKLLGTKGQTLAMEKQAAINFLMKKIKEWDKKTV